MTEWNPDHDFSLVYRYGTPDRAITRIVEVQIPLPAVHVARIPTPEDVAREVTADIVAMSGGNSMITWLCRSRPALPRITVLGLFGVDRSHLEKLARSGFLAQIKRLVVYEAIDWDAFGSSLARIEALAVIAKHADQLDVPVDTMPALRELKLKLSAYPHESETLAIVDRVCASVTGPVLRLELERLQVPIDTIVANPALASLHMLIVHHGTFRGAELLCGLEKLRVLHAMNLCDGMPRAVLSCTTIQELFITGPEVDDDYLVLLADSDLKLRTLWLDNQLGPPNPYGTRGVRAIESGRSTVNIERIKLRTYPLDPLTAIRLATSKRIAFRNLISRHDYESWRPKPDQLAEAPVWPSAPIERRFFDEHVEVCGDCFGSGYTPEGGCAQHYDDELIVREVTEPPAGIRIAAASIAAIEARAIAIEPDASAIHWHYRDRDRAFTGPLPPKPFDALDARFQAWPYVLATTDDPRAEHVIAIVELGVRILGIEDGVVSLILVDD